MFVVQILPALEDEQKLQQAIQEVHALLDGAVK
jgi:hypothetical protein